MPRPDEFSLEDPLEGYDPNGFYGYIAKDRYGDGQQFRTYFSAALVPKFEVVRRERWTQARTIQEMLRNAVFHWFIGEAVALAAQDHPEFDTDTLRLIETEILRSKRLGLEEHLEECEKQIKFLNTLPAKLTTHRREMLLKYVDSIQQAASSPDVIELCEKTRAILR